MQPTLRQFEVFLAVAKAGSFRAAAEAMHLSQPALSQHVAEVERELGTHLFDRLGRKIALTEAGRILEEHALRLFASLASAREAIADLGGLKRGSLVVGASTTPGIYVLPRVIAAFRDRYPGIDLAVQIGNSAVTEERIRANELDLGVVGGHALHAGEECLTAGLVDELLLVVPPHDRAAPDTGTRLGHPAGDRTRAPAARRPIRGLDGARTHRSDQASGNGRPGHRVHLGPRGAWRGRQPPAVGA